MLVRRHLILLGWSHKLYAMYPTWTTAVDQLGFVLASLWWRYSLNEGLNSSFMLFIYSSKRVSLRWNFSVNISRPAEVKEWLVHPVKTRNLIAKLFELSFYWKADLNCCSRLGLEAFWNLVELAQVGIVSPVEPLQALHGHRDLHEGREVANVEILNTADLPLGKNDLGSGELSLQVFQGIKVLPCLE